MTEIPASRVLSALAPAICSLALVSPCVGAVILSDSFSGAALVDLNNTQASVSQGFLAAGGNATWVANAAFGADGSINFTTGSGLARLALGDYVWNALGTQSGLFTLTSTVAITSGTWISVGFFHTEAVTSTYFSNGSPGPGMSTALLRSTNVINYYGGKGVNSASTPGSAASPVTFTIALDLRGWNGTTNFGTVTFSNDKVGTSTTVALPSDGDVNPFQFVGFSGNSSANGTISNFSLSQIPEPSAMLILLTLPILGFSRKR
jgi:hypothetical protein